MWRHRDRITQELARRIEDLGYGAIWVGASPAGDLSPVPDLLAATERIVIATGVVNMWATTPEVAAEAYHRLTLTFPDRFLLGVGIGHRESSAGYRSPYATIVDYLDRLDTEGVPASGRVLAALGPRVLRVSAPTVRSADAIVDALAVHGDAVAVAAGLTAHLQAGADHVCAQVLTEAGGDPLPALAAVADVLGLRPVG